MPRPMPVLQMHTVVVQPLTSNGTGSISCRPLGQEPIEFTWLTPDGSPPAELDHGDSEARGLPPGRYRVDAVDATGMHASVVVDIEPMFSTAVCIESYKTTPASTSLSRDGSVELVGTGVQGHRYLWTNGTETGGCVLRDVPCGTYAAMPIVTGSDQTIPVLVHSALPARVDVAASGRWG